MITCRRLVTAQQAPREGKEVEGLASEHCVVWVVGWWIG